MNGLCVDLAVTLFFPWHRSVRGRRVCQLPGGPPYSRCLEGAHRLAGVTLVSRVCYRLPGLLRLCCQTSVRDAMCGWHPAGAPTLSNACASDGNAYWRCGHQTGYAMVHIVTVHARVAAT